MFDNCRFLFWMVGIFLCMCGMHTSCGCVRARHTHVCVHVWHVHVVCVSSSHSPSVSVFRCVLLVRVCACLVVCVCVRVTCAHRTCLFSRVLHAYALCMSAFRRVLCVHTCMRASVFRFACVSACVPVCACVCTPYLVPSTTLNSMSTIVKHVTSSPAEAQVTTQSGRPSTSCRVRGKQYCGPSREHFVFLQTLQTSP